MNKKYKSFMSTYLSNQESIYFLVTENISLHNSNLHIF